MVALTVFCISCIRGAEFVVLGVLAMMEEIAWKLLHVFCIVEVIRDVLKRLDQGDYKGPGRGINRRRA